MNAFPVAHATHPDWRAALALARSQLEGQLAQPGTPAPTLGWVYFTDHHAAAAQALLGELRSAFPGVSWVGTVGVGVAAGGVEHFDEPGLVLMLAALPRTAFQVFSGQQPLRGFAAHTALVHADPATPEIAELVADLAERTTTGYLFGGLASSRGATLHIADAVLHGGVSGVAFSDEVALVSRVTQGCQPIGPRHRIAEATGNVINRLDDGAALDCLLAELAIDEADIRRSLPRLRATFVGLTDAADAADSAADARGAFGPDTRVRHLVGLDPGRRGIAIADHAEAGQWLAFCRRDREAARRDLVRICSEIREEIEAEAPPLPALTRAPHDAAAEQGAARGIAGAIYVSCSGRGGPHFGGPSAELQIVRHALGDVPLVGFFAAGEIARHHLYGYTGVLTVFRSREA